MIAGNVRFPCIEQVKSHSEAGKGWSTFFRKKKYKGNMAKKLYVGGLPYSTTEDELRDAFSQAGAVSTATIIMDRMSGRSKGFGFVEMTNDEDAQKAIDMWNGKQFGGRTLTVNEARPMEERPRNGGYRGNDRSGFGGGQGGRNW